MTQTRVTQVAIESVDSPTPGSRVTQTAIEGVTVPTPPSRITQLGIEALISQSPLSRISQLVLEVLLPYAEPAVLPSGGSAQLWPRAGGPLPGYAGDPAGGDASGTLDALTVTGLKGVPMVGTLGTGQVWVKDSTAQLIPFTPGTPTAAYTIFDPFVPDTSPHALNEEFTTSSLAGFGTGIYTGDASVVVDANTTIPGWLFMEAPNVNYRFRALPKTLPGDTNWTIHTCMAVLTGAATDGFWGGLMLSNGATAGSGNQHGIGAHPIGASADANCRKHRVFWDGWGNTASGAAGAEFGHGHPGLIFLRWRKQSGTYYMGWSNDGRLWWETSTTLYASMTPTHFALAAQNYTGNAVLRCAFKYLRYYANGTQLLTGANRTVYA